MGKIVKEMTTPDEFKNKVPLTIGAIIWVAAVSFSMGVLYASMVGAKKDIVDNKQAAKDYVEQEVGGLRSDWERQNEISKRERLEIRDDVKELQEYHKEK